MSYGPFGQRTTGLVWRMLGMVLAGPGIGPGEQAVRVS
jgi:hypothetical protein